MVLLQQIQLDIFVNMKYASALLAGLAAMASAKEIPKDPVRAAELYDSGVMHQRIMEKKAAKLAEEESMGVLNSIDGPVYQELPFAQCKDGIAQPFRNLAHARFRCNNVCFLNDSYTTDDRLTEIRSTCTTSFPTPTLEVLLALAPLHGVGSRMMAVSLPSLPRVMVLLSQRSPMLESSATWAVFPRRLVLPPAAGGKSVP